MAEDNQSLDRMSKNAEVRHWLSEQALYDRQAEIWINTAKRYISRYRNDGVDAKKVRRFDIFSSNTEILLAATFGQTPPPDVSRRWHVGDDEELQKTAQRSAIILEKVLRYNADQTEQFGVPIDQCNQDTWIGGRGNVRIGIEQDFQDSLDADGAVLEERPVDQRAPLRYVHWQDFSHSPARVWADVSWLRYRHLMTKDDLRKHRATRKRAADIPLTVTIGASGDLAIQDSKRKGDPPSTFSRAEVWEYWDRQREEIVWMARGLDDVLLKESPLVQFDGFFDCPEPLRYGGTNDTLIPIPEYSRYEALATELDDITMRLAGLVSMAKAVFGYDPGGPAGKDMSALAAASDGKFIPFPQGAASGARALKDMIYEWPLETIVIAIRELSLRQDQLKQAIFEIEGISDIIRGSSNPNETLGAQNLKAQFGSFRLQTKQIKMQRFVQKCYQLQGEVAAELYTAETLQRISGEVVDEQVMGLLRNDRMRGYQVDVSLEELVRPDQEAQKQSAVEYVTAMTSYLETAATLLQVAPEFAPVIGEMGKMAQRQFKAGRQMEESFDQAIEQLTARAQQPQPEQGPSPDVVAKEEGASKREMAKSMTALQLKEMDLEASGRAQVGKAATDLQLEDERGKNRGNGAAS